MVVKRMCALLVLLVAACAARGQSFDQYGGYTGLKGSNTSGFFRVEKIGGRYWLVTPENNVFWSTGICVLQYMDGWGGYCPTLDYSPNPCSNKAKYTGGIDEWRQTISGRMDRWGWNTQACWGITDVPNKAECLRDLSLPGRAKSAGCRMVTSDFPDLWDPIWESTCDTRCNQLLTPYKDDPWKIGSFPYNELRWANPYGYACIPDAYIAQPSDAPGKQHWVNDFLKSKYATIGDLNTAWGTSYTDWTDLLDVTEVADDDNYPARLDDKIDFVEDIADRFYSIATQYMRLYDPNHLVFTTRWAMWYDGYASEYDRPFNERIWKKAGEYCDVFANNGYADFGSAEATYQHSSRVFQNAKIPFIVTEHAYLANDSYFRDSPHWLPTQMDRGVSYLDQVKKLLDMGVDDDPNDPGNPAKTCMGIHWFQLYDEPALGRPDGERAQFGVFNCQDEAFLPFVEVASTVHDQVYDYLIDETQIDVPEAPTAVSPVKSYLQSAENASSFERVYYASELSHAAGTEASDPDAALGTAWLATVAEGQQGAYMVYGPYDDATSFWPGVDCTVTYRIKVSDNSSSDPVATIDATTNNSSNTLASQQIAGTDFAATGVYQEFTLNFTTPDPGQNDWEFRVKFHGIADVYVDTIKVAMMPTGSWLVGPVSDGDNSSQWWSAQHDTASAAEWCAISFGDTSVEIGSVSINSGVTTPAGMPVDFELQYSEDALQWHTIPGQSFIGYPGGLGANEFEFDPVDCRYFRLYATRLGQDADGKYRTVLSGIDVPVKTTTTTPALDWTYGGDAQTYTVLLSPVAHFPEEQTIKIEGLTNTSYTPTTPLAQGTWYWTAKAVDSEGHEGHYLRTVEFLIGDVPDSELNHTAALACEQLADWRNVDREDTAGDGYSFAFLDGTIKSEGSHSFRVAITVNSLNKTTSEINAGTSDIPFRYAGLGLDYSGADNFTFDIYPKRFCDITQTIVPSSKYLRFRMLDASGNTVVDQAVDPTGSLPIEEWSAITVPLSGRRCQVTGIEFYVNAGQEKLTWDERVFFNIDNLLQAPLADMSPPTTPVVDTAGYTVDNSVSAVIQSDDPESGVAEYFYAVGSAPGLDNIVAWRSNGLSPVVEESGLGLSDGEACYVGAKAVSGIDVESFVGFSPPVTKVTLAAGANAARQLPLGSWTALQDQTVTAVFPDRIYVERPDRSCGIGVICNEPVSVGDRVTVYGETAVDNREGVILGHLSNKTGGQRLAPVAVNNRWTAGAATGIQESPVNDAAGGSYARGLTNVGCLVTTFGTVTYLDPAQLFFYLDDGSGIQDGSGYTGVRVNCADLPVPAESSFVCVTGVAGTAEVNGDCARVLRPREFSDLQYERVGNYVANAGFERNELTPWVTVGVPGAVETDTQYGFITAHSGDLFFASHGYYQTNSGTIYQVVGVAPGRSYRTSVFSNVYHWDPSPAAARNRLGIDPNGGVDPDAPNVIWSAWDENLAWTSGWHELTVPDVIPAGDTLTVFLQYSQAGTFGYNINCFDDAVVQSAEEAMENV